MVQEIPFSISFEKCTTKCVHEYLYISCKSDLFLVPNLFGEVVARLLRIKTIPSLFWY